MFFFLSSSKCRGGLKVKGILAIPKMVHQKKKVVWAWPAHWQQDWPAASYQQKHAKKVTWLQGAGRQQEQSIKRRRCHQEGRKDVTVHNSLSSRFLPHVHWTLFFWLGGPWTTLENNTLKSLDVLNSLKKSLKNAWKTLKKWLPSVNGEDNPPPTLFRGGGGTQYVSRKMRRKERHTKYAKKESCI